MMIFDTLLPAYEKPFHQRVDDYAIPRFNQVVFLFGIVLLTLGVMTLRAQPRIFNSEVATRGNMTVKASSTDQPEQEVFTIYMAPRAGGGSDDHDGLTKHTAVYTLQRVHEILTEKRPDTDVEIRIRQGTYISKPFQEWRFYVPGHSVSFLPLGYKPGDDIEDKDALPIFRNARCGGHYCGGFWLQPRLPKDPDDPLHKGGNSNLRFYYLQIEYYQAGGLSIFGNSERDWEDNTWDPPLHIKPTEGLNNNLIFGMQFRKNGNKWSGGSWGYGAIILTNSSDNRIVNSHFVNIENSDHPANIHGVYTTHHSSNNVIKRNYFSYISGYPVKIRNQSNSNRIQNNTIQRAGWSSFYRGEFCDTQCAKKHEMAQQCASVGNQFYNNRLRENYHGEQPSSVWSLSPEGIHQVGGAPCEVKSHTKRRVYISGNEQE